MAVLLGCQTLPSFLRRESVEVSNRSLYADIGCGEAQQKCFKGPRPAKSGVITYN